MHVEVSRCFLQLPVYSTSLINFKNSFRPGKVPKVEKKQKSDNIFLSLWSLILLPDFFVLCCALSAHTCACLFLPVLFIFGWLVGCHTAGAGTVYIDIFGLTVLHVNMTRQTNKTRDLTPQGLLRIPFNGIFYNAQIVCQNYQGRKIRLSIRLAHQAYWTRHTEPLNCQPTNCLLQDSW